MTQWIYDHEDNLTKWFYDSDTNVTKNITLSIGFDCIESYKEHIDLYQNNSKFDYFETICNEFFFYEDIKLLHQSQSLSLKVDQSSKQKC